jgi:hypothetical protein
MRFLVLAMRACSSAAGSAEWSWVHGTPSCMCTGAAPAAVLAAGAAGTGGYGLAEITRHIIVCHLMLATQQDAGHLKTREFALRLMTWRTVCAGPSRRRVGRVAEPLLHLAGGSLRTSNEPRSDTPA